MWGYVSRRRLTRWWHFPEADKRGKVIALTRLHVVVKAGPKGRSGELWCGSGWNQRRRLTSLLFKPSNHLSNYPHIALAPTLRVYLAERTERPE